METLARQVLRELLSHICVFAGSKEALLYQQASLEAQERGWRLVCFWPPPCSSPLNDNSSRCTNIRIFSCCAAAKSYWKTSTDAVLNSSEQTTWQAGIFVLWKNSCALHLQCALNLRNHISFHLESVMIDPHDIWRVSTLWQPLTFTTIIQCFHIWLHIRTVHQVWHSSIISFTKWRSSSLVNNQKWQWWVSAGM